MKLTYVFPLLRNIVVPSLAIMICELSSAAGFGFQMGEAPTTYNCDALDARPGTYKCVAPKPHSSFESYVIEASEKHGICWVKGVGKDISDNGYGTNTQTEHEKLVTLLSKPYGAASEKTDFILPSALWDDPNEWLMSIAKKERYVISTWKDLKLASKPALDKIYLGVGATSGKTGYITVEYHAKNYSDCVQANAESESDAL